MTFGIREKMVKRADFQDGCSVQLSGGVRADDLEESLAQFYSKNSSNSKPLLIDFEKATYIDLPVLFCLTSIFISRRSNDLHTYIGIPESKAVRDFLRVWRYPSAFRAATGVRFEDIMLPEDHRYRGEEQVTYQGGDTGLAYLEYNPDWRVGHPGRRNFFEFSTNVLDVGDDNNNAIRSARQRNLPRSEASLWNGSLIKEVLGHHLADSGSNDDVPRVIIYESLSNAVRHPKAQLIQAASRFQWRHAYDSAKKSSNRVPKGTFRMCFWDDGESIVNTLKPIVQKGLTLRSITMPSYMYESIYVQERVLGSSFTDGAIISQKDDPSPSSSDGILLLSSTFPGISRAISEDVGEVDPYEHKNVSSPELADKQGMGLYGLIRTVLDLYQGELYIRSGRHLLVIKIAHDAWRKEKRVRYKARITEFPEEYPSLVGNLLAVNLPVY